MSFQDLGATGIIAAVVLALGVIGFIKGLIRTILALVCLAIAGYASLWGHEHASDLTSPWLENPGPWMPKIIAVLTGLLIFMLCRYLLHFLIDPFDQSKTGSKIGFGVPAAIISLCTGLAIIWSSFTGIRYAGSLAELRHTTQNLTTDQDAETHPAPLLMQARRALDASSAGKFQRMTDPFHTPLKLELCQLLILYHHGATRQQMLTDPAIRPLLNHPQFIELAYRKPILEAAQSNQPRTLYQAPEIQAFLDDPANTSLLETLKNGQFAAFLPPSA